MAFVVKKRAGIPNSKTIRCLLMKDIQISKATKEKKNDVFLKDLCCSFERVDEAFRRVPRFVACAIAMHGGICSAHTQVKRCWCCERQRDKGGR